jgi:hypothetical protein
MTIKGTIVSILMVITVMVFASDIRADNFFPAEAPAEAEEELTLPEIFRINRDVPCTSTQMVQAILYQRGQLPIAQGTATMPTEVFSEVVLALNEETSEFSIVIVNIQSGITCNIYSGVNFRLIGQ